MEMTRTRQSIGSQLREALDDMVARRTIHAWAFIPHADGVRTMYQLEAGNGSKSLGMLPGECMDYLNQRGYDIRFGKA